MVELALAEDLGDRGDVTSALSIPADTIITGRIRAKEAGVIAGLEIVRMVYAQIDPAVTVDLLLTDGTSVEVGTVICEVRGAGRSVLSGERVALNFLQHLCGVASLTAKFVAAVKGTKAVILDTRKTTPGWRLLEKYAVRMGGGQNHRIGLYDMVLIKDNHIDAAGGITAAVTAAQAAALPIEVEVKNLDELCEALTLKVDRILLDNMNLQQMRQAVTITAGHVPLEASGNMALDRVAAVAATGVDYISVGALTHSAPALDLSMRLSS
ncbi:MAG: carboxylating nicotinate-nucleotide diphosphorylase [Chloroflexi bacterium]|uniref:carboxylating nicotinate-nucleotide diphosphorylase n=1 Tax=Candidatus Flexifilum breve TaxID=3140694 RepID=UPI00313611F6|nr:carboxylating nicotinate-nucleotide diphosphorylase [Chloroflexota bacterium]